MSKLVKIIGICAGVVFAGIAIGWFVSRPLPRDATVAPLPSEKTNPSVATVPVSPSVGPSAIKAAPANKGDQTVEATPAVAPANLVTNWEEKVDTILSSDKEDREKAKQMLELLPRVPADGQAEVAQHLSNLTPDGDYAGLAQYLTQGGVTEAAQDVLMADVLNRPNSVKLPTLLEVARTPDNPKAGEAKDVLQLYLEEDFGTDWTAWQTKLEQWLKDNPD